MSHLFSRVSRRRPLRDLTARKLPPKRRRQLLFESLEDRRVLDGETTISIIGEIPTLRDELVPGGFMEHTRVFPTGNEGTSPLEPGQRPPLGFASPIVENRSGTFDIVLQKSAALAGNAPASAAFDRAAAFWESHFTDPITVYIDAHFGDTPLGGDPFGGSTLGSASSTGALLAYSDVVTALKQDASNDESIASSLPEPGLITFNLAADITLFETSTGSSTTTPTNPLMSVNRANAHALGFRNLAGAASLTSGANAVDAKISFNSAFAFDFDKSDGITTNQTDFEAVALHEIGHALGFVSEVDTVDFYRTRTTPTAHNVYPAPMDLFRLAPGATFATAPRVLNTGNIVPIQVFHDGQFNSSSLNGKGGLSGLVTGDIPMSTGAILFGTRFGEC